MVGSINIRYPKCEKGKFYPIINQRFRFDLFMSVMETFITVIRDISCSSGAGGWSRPCTTNSNILKISTDKKL